MAFEPGPPPEIDPVSRRLDAPELTPRARRSIVKLALAFYGVLLLAAFAWAALDGRALVFAPPPGASTPAWALGAGLLTAAIFVWVSSELTERTRVGEQLARSLAAVLGPLTLGECWLLAALSGLAEEAFFRGALQPQLGLVAASLLFGAAHFVPRRELFAWTPFAIAAGFALGLLYDATGSLLAPVVAHAGINGVNLRRLAQRRWR